MAKLNPESAWEFADAIKAIVKPQNNRRKATVQNVDKDGTIWVSLPGSSTVTPIQSTGVNVSPGDTVLTELRGTSLHITENQTNPAIGENTARSIAKQETQHAEAMAKQAKTIADEAQAVAEATNQHFFADTNGAHITDVTQDEWAQAVEDNFSDYDPTTKPYHNQLLNSLGILLRTALNNLVSITRSAIAFYDGQGNNAANIVARFGSSGAQIGKSSAAHSVIDADGQRFYGGTNGATQLANIGYGEGAAQSGTAYAPYYTFGTRATNSTVGNYSFASGGQVTASGWNSHAEGNRTTASGIDSHAEGLSTTASGGYSHAEGSNTTASGDEAHAEGYDTTASGELSHAEGQSTVARGLLSHAEGYYTTASGYYSHAEGFSAVASGNQSHAQNYGTVAASASQTAIGKYNVPDSRTDTFTGDGATTAFTLTATPEPRPLFSPVLVEIDGAEVHRTTYTLSGTTLTFNTAPASGAVITVTYNLGTYALIIGNGTDDNNRSNAFAVTWGGAADLSHTLTTQQYTKAYTAAANSGSGAVDITITKSGYTPIGIVGVGSGSQSVSVVEFSLLNNTTARCYFRNVSGSAASPTCNVTVLYTAVV